MEKQKTKKVVKDSKTGHWAKAPQTEAERDQTMTLTVPVGKRKGQPVMFSCPIENCKGALIDEAMQIIGCEHFPAGEIVGAIKTYVEAKSESADAPVEIVDETNGR